MVEHNFNELKPISITNYTYGMYIGLAVHNYYIYSTEFMIMHNFCISTVIVLTLSI